MGEVFRSVKSDYDSALVCYQKGLNISEELGDKGDISIIFNNMGIILHTRGDTDHALEYYQKALVIAEQRCEKRVISYVAGNMGVIHFENKEYRRAEKLLEKAVGISRELNTKPQLVDFLPYRALLALAQNQFSRVEELCREALELARLLKNDEKIIAMQILSHKIAFAAAGDNATRQTVIESLETLLTETNSKEQHADIHYELIAMHRTLNRPDQAEHHRQEALKHYEELYAKVPKFAYKKKIEELQKTEI